MEKLCVFFIFFNVFPILPLHILYTQEKELHSCITIIKLSLHIRSGRSFDLPDLIESPNYVALIIRTLIIH